MSCCFMEPLLRPLIEVRFLFFYRDSSCSPGGSGCRPLSSTAGSCVRCTPRLACSCPHDASPCRGPRGPTLRLPPLPCRTHRRFRRRTMTVRLARPPPHRCSWSAASRSCVARWMIRSTPRRARRRRGRSRSSPWSSTCRCGLWGLRLIEWPLRVWPSLAATAAQPQRMWQPLVRTPDSPLDGCAHRLVTSPRRSVGLRVGARVRHAQRHPRPVGRAKGALGAPRPLRPSWLARSHWVTLTCTDARQLISGV
jgi:hypothetical protein